MADLLPLHIVARDGEWLVLSRPGDAVVSRHATLKHGALDAVLGTPGFVARDPRFADGEWRWIDMTATEAKPSDDGSQVTERGIQSMAVRLNGGDPIMVDGGSDDSGAHDSLIVGGDTRANGWAHVAVEVRDERGRLHLWGRVEVLAPIAADMDANRLALGSIGFATPGGDNDAAFLVQHALTNLPAVQGLTPAGSPRHATTHVHYRSLRRALAVGDVVYVDPATAHMPEASGRGVVAEVSAEPAVAVRFDSEPEAIHRWYVASEFTQAPLRAANATGERLMTTAATVREEAPANPKPRAEEMVDLSPLREALDLPPDADFAAIVEACKAMKPADAPAEDEAAKAKDAEVARSLDAVETLRAEVAALRADALRAKPMVAQHEARERADKVTALLAARGIQTPEAIKRWSAHAEKFGEQSAANGIELAAAPPTGTIAKPETSQRTAPESALVAPAADEDAIDAAAELLMAEVRQSHPRDPRHIQFGRARRLAVKRNPSLGAA